MNPDAGGTHTVSRVHPAWFRPVPAAAVTRLQPTPLGRRWLWVRLVEARGPQEIAPLVPGSPPESDNPAHAAILAGPTANLMLLGSWCYAGLLRRVVDGSEVRRLHRVFGAESYKSAIEHQALWRPDRPTLLAEEFHGLMVNPSLRAARRVVQRRGIQEAWGLLKANHLDRSAAWFRLRFRPGRIDSDFPGCLNPEALQAFCRLQETRQ